MYVRIGQFAAWRAATDALEGADGLVQKHLNIDVPAHLRDLDDRVFEPALLQAKVLALSVPLFGSTLSQHVIPNRFFTLAANENSNSREEESAVGISSSSRKQQIAHAAWGRFRRAVGRFVKRFLSYPTEGWGAEGGLQAKELSTEEAAREDHADEHVDWQSPDLRLFGKGKASPAPAAAAAATAAATAPAASRNKSPTTTTNTEELTRELTQNNWPERVWDAWRAAFAVFLMVSCNVLPNGPFIRPHPDFWRLVLGVLIWYWLNLIFIFNLEYREVREILAWLYPQDTGSYNVGKLEWRVEKVDAAAATATSAALNQGQSGQTSGQATAQKIERGNPNLPFDFTTRQPWAEVDFLDSDNYIGPDCMAETAIYGDFHHKMPRFCHTIRAYVRERVRVHGGGISQAVRRVRAVPPVRVDGQGADAAQLHAVLGDVHLLGAHGALLHPHHAQLRGVLVGPHVIQNNSVLPSQPTFRS